MRRAIELVMIVGLAISLFAQSPEQDARYKKFFYNYQSPAGQQIAYKAAKEYLQNKPQDEEQAKYVADWVGKYERALRELEVRNLILQKNFTEAVKKGKEALASDPNNLYLLYDILSASVQAGRDADPSLPEDGITMGLKAIKLVESGTALPPGDIFATRDEILGRLNLSVAQLKLVQHEPESALPYIAEALRHPGAVQKAPETYYNLALAYESGPYKKLASAYNDNFADKPETEEGKQALSRVNEITDRTIDAYARAVALSSANSDIYSRGMAHLTELYKSRHDGSDTGLQEMISKVLTQPMPPASANEK